MAEHSKYFNREGEMGSMKKRSSLLHVVLTLGAIALFSLAVAVTEVQAGTKLSLSVVTHSFDGPGFGAAGPFNIEGDVFVEGEEDSVGTFQCWGWIKFVAGELVFSNVSQVYNIDTPPPESAAERL